MDSLSGQAFAFAQAHGKILVSVALLSELQTVLDRAKFEAYVTPTERNHFLTARTREATLVTATGELHAARDPNDNFFLELAVSGGAEVIISGDADLLALHTYDSIHIKSPADFLQEARA